MSKYPEIDAVLAGESDGCIINGDCLEVMAEIPKQNPRHRETVVYVGDQKNGQMDKTETSP